MLLWDMTLEVVSVNGDATSYYLDSASHLVQEPDGVRVLGSTAHDLLQKVGLEALMKILHKNVNYFVHVFCGYIKNC